MTRAVRRAKGKQRFGVLFFLVAVLGFPSWQTYREMQKERASVALIAAITRHDTPAALAALEAGANPKATAHASTPSFWQALRDHWNHLRSVRPAQAEEPTALLLATATHVSPNGELEPTDTRLIRALLEHGAEVNARDINGRTVLMGAALYGPVASVEVLLQHGAEVNAKDSDGGTALMWVPDSQQIASMEVLLQHGAEVNARDNNGRTVLMGAAFNGQIANMEVLLQHGAEINARANNGETALMHAASGPVKSVEFLLQHGAEVNARDNTGWTALRYAIQAGQSKSVAALRKAGAKQ